MDFDEHTLNYAAILYFHPELEGSGPSDSSSNGSGEGPTDHSNHESGTRSGDSLCRSFDFADDDDLVV